MARRPAGHGASCRSVACWRWVALVDSGADSSLVPMQVAGLIGVTTKGVLYLIEQRSLILLRRLGNCMPEVCGLAGRSLCNLQGLGLAFPSAHGRGRGELTARHRARFAVPRPVFTGFRDAGEAPAVDCVAVGAYGGVRLIARPLIGARTGAPREGARCELDGRAVIVVSVP